MGRFVCISVAINEKNLAIIMIVMSLCPLLFLLRFFVLHYIFFSPPFTLTWLVILLPHDHLRIRFPSAEVGTNATLSLEPLLFHSVVCVCVCVCMCVCVSVGVRLLSFFRWMVSLSSFFDIYIHTHTHTHTFTHLSLTLRSRSCFFSGCRDGGGGGRGASLGW
jgi:hypothetical protein